MGEEKQKRTKEEQREQTHPSGRTAGPETAAGSREKPSRQHGKYEERLNESDERYRALLNAIPDTIYRIRTDGTILDFKAEKKKLQGWDESWVGRMLAETPLPGKTSSEILALIQQAVGTGRPRRYEFDMVVGDAPRTFETRIVKSGKDEAVCIVRDVTGQRQAEQALRESENKFRSIAEQSMVGIYLFQDDRMKYVNERCGEIFGYRTEEIIGIRSPLDFVHPDHRIMVEENIRKRLSGDAHALHYEFTGVRKDGEPVYVEAYGVRTVYQTKTAILGTLLDRTEGKKLEAQLIQAEKMKAIGALAGGIAHDFNNLLMSIQGYTSLMLHHLQPDDVHHGKLKGIEELVQSGSELTKQLLTFASGGTYRIRQADLNEIVKRTSSMFGRTKREITIQQRYENAPCVVDVDSTHIEQILLNLYLNAWQAMPGGGTLTLETQNVALDKDFVKPHSVKPGKYARISVTDTGEGMDKKTKERIFEPFFTTKKMGRGTGIGLASVYSVVKGHHGIINVFSEKGCGTAFHIYLPISKKTVEKPAPVPDEVFEGDETILIVDDEESVISVSRDMLEALGYSVLIARSGHEAVEVYERNRAAIDLVILDMVMPDMGGEETFVHLKEINPSVAVVLSSGYSLDGLTTTIMEQGCKAFIQKPFTINVLSQRLAEVLGREPSNG
jgi:PAS domain S-box-containing protein